MIRVIDVEMAVEVMNRINEADPTVLPALLTQRVWCNDAVPDRAGLDA
jgi:hypothetical protein